MSVSILVVDDEPDVADLFRQQFRRETRQGTYVMHFAGSGEQALDLLAVGSALWPPFPLRASGNPASCNCFANSFAIIDPSWS